jgi:hypothetical protein
MSSSSRPPSSPFDPGPAPPSFWRTGEFKLIARLFLYLIIVGGLAAYALLQMHGTTPPPVAESEPDFTEEAVRTTPPTPAELDERERFLVTAFEGALSDSMNGEDLRETPGYRKLLKTIGDYTPEEVTSRAKRNLSYAAALADPDGWRGQFVRARGVIAGLNTVALDRPDEVGRQVVYRGVLADGDATRGVLFDLTDHPGEKPSIQGTAYDVEGIFYRVARFENRHGKYKEVPWLIVRNLRPVPSALERRAGFLHDYGLYLLGGMALIIAGLLVYSLQRRSGPSGPNRPAKAESIRQMFERRLREEGSPPPPSATP